MAPQAKSSSTGAPLKQGTISFASSKRGATAAGKANVNAVKAVPSVISSTKPPGAERRVSGSRTLSNDSTISVGTTSTSGISEDEDIILSTGSAGVAQHVAKRFKMSSGAAKAVNGGMKHRTPATDTPAGEEPQDLNILEKSGRLAKLYGQSREKMGNQRPIHAEKQTMVHQILRTFDTSYEYGPCVGMTRLERWERAHALGLKPPVEIRDILTTMKASLDDGLKQSVFHGDV
ncbi:hypothetical protein EW145_g6848 [Phellinidium pouzarii]|uniref:DNA polymerase delta subunit 4 n=1 Tax=Phellinidium pouzarii TaxID=167371 RepID=A0A4S4KTP0_9AGAM|nr:hypothetical protein EW145_g6848 [Phellinidium pouzarii]